MGLWQELCGAAGIVGLLVAWVQYYVRSAAKEEVSTSMSVMGTAINDIRTRLALLEDRTTRAERDIKETDDYGHASHHELANEFSAVRSEAIELERRLWSDVERRLSTKRQGS